MKILYCNSDLLTKHPKSSSKIIDTIWSKKGFWMVLAKTINLLTKENVLCS